MSTQVESKQRRIHGTKTHDICGKVRRELVSGTLKVYPMHGYGNVATEHPSVPKQVWRGTVILGLSLFLFLSSQPVDAREPTVAEFERLMTTLAEAWSEQDTKRALSCFTADALYMQPPDQQLYRGPGELGKLFNALRPGTLMTFHNLAFNAQARVGFGEFSFGRSGAAKADHGVVLVTLRAGRIAVWREYFEEGPASFSEFVAAEGKTWKWTAKDLQ